jgi:hypothetical protein
MIKTFDHIRVLSQNKILKGDLSVQDRGIRELRLLNYKHFPDVQINQQKISKKLE